MVVPSEAEAYIEAADRDRMVVAGIGPVVVDTVVVATRVVAGTVRIVVDSVGTVVVGLVVDT